MEPPSPNIVDLLQRAGLCSSRDLRRCRPYVRRLARDLPTFDSVWIDALTQTRKLTPFQAQVVSSPSPERLIVGPCVLVERWQHDARSTLYLGRHLTSRQNCLLTFLHPLSDRHRPAPEPVRDLLSRLKSAQHPSLLIPQGCDLIDDQLVVVSPTLTGPTLRELLVRRGRFPLPVVAEIARQLISALLELERHDLVHGDITLDQVRLTQQGTAVLLNPGIAWALGSHVSIHSIRSPDACDGIAPELIGSGNPGSKSSDMYALGCLLYQLLAGRPPFPTGDPLAKLSCHQTKSIDDVRRWVPDTPADLAGLIHRVTRGKVADRPQQAADLPKLWRGHRQSQRRELSRFAHSFRTAAPRLTVPGEERHFPWKSVAMLLMVIGGLSYTLYDAGARNELLRLTSLHATVSRWRGDAPATPSIEPATRTDGLQSLPGEPVGGVIELDGDATYAAGSLLVRGPVTLRGTGPSPARIVVQGESLKITATEVRLENVHIFRQSSRSENLDPVPLLELRCQTLVTQACRFENAVTEGLATAIRWQALEEASTATSRLVLVDTIFRGAMNSLEARSLPRFVGLDNCLKLGPQPLIVLPGQTGTHSVQMHLRQTTLRESGGIVHWDDDGTAPQIPPVLLIAEDSVFDIPAALGGLVEFAAGQPPRGWEGMIRITGEGSVVAEHSLLAACAVTPESVPVPLDESSVRLDGLMIDAFRFAGPVDDDPNHSVVIETQAPRRTATPPGIIGSRLGRVTTSPLALQSPGS